MSNTIDLKTKIAEALFSTELDEHILSPTLMYRLHFDSYYKPKYGKLKFAAVLTELLGLKTNPDKEGFGICTRDCEAQIKPNGELLIDGFDIFCACEKGKEDKYVEYMVSQFRPLIASKLLIPMDE